MSTLAQLGDERYVSLTTFRRSGDGVATAVWVVRDGDALLVTTNGSSGKVKRLRHTARVTLVPCDVRGRVADGAEPTEARAEVLDDPADVAHVQDLVNAEYGLLARAIALGGRLRRGGSTVGVRIAAAG